MKLPCVYILASKPRGTLYVGATGHLQERVWEHREGVVPGFTRKYGVKMLVYYEVHETMDAALLRERQIKEWKRTWKIELIESKNPNWDDLFEGLGPA